MNIKIIMVSSTLLFGGAIWYGVGSNGSIADHQLSAQKLSSQSSLVMPSKTNADLKVSAPESSVPLHVSSKISNITNDSLVPAILDAWTLMDPIENTPELATALPDNALENTAYAIRLDPNFTDQTQLSLSLPNGQILNMERAASEKMPSGSVSWVGKSVQDPDLFAVLTKNGNTIAGDIETPDGATYLITTVADGRHVIYQQNDQKLTQMSLNDDALLPPNLAKVALDKASASDQLMPLSAKNTQNDSSTSIIKVLFVFTQEAVNKSGLRNLQAQVDTAIVAANNRTFPGSKVNMRIQQVGPNGKAVIYGRAEGNDISATLVHLANNAAIKTSRSNYGADLVQGVISHNDYCGEGYLNSYKNLASQWGYSVISRSCIGYSMLHELGHNMGLDHDKANAFSSNRNDINLGYRQCGAGGFRTIMSYPCSGDAPPRIKLFSNPDVNYNGQPAGSSSANNASILENYSRGPVSRFR